MIAKYFNEVTTMKISRRLLAFLLMLLLCAGSSALAEDVYTVDNAAAISSCTIDCGYLRIRCPLEGEQQVTMTVHDAWGGLCYQRDYGLCSGTFHSEDVYLRLDGASAVYTVTLQTGSDAHRFTVTRQQPRLTDTGVSALGLSVQELTGKRSNKYAVIIDVDSLEGSTLSVPLVSGRNQLGYASFTVLHGELTVSAVLTVDGSIDKSNVYVARDAVAAQTLGTSSFTGQKVKLNRAVDLSSTPYAAVLLQLTVSYDETTAIPLQTDRLYLQQQDELWDLMQMTTANEAVG